MFNPFVHFDSRMLPGFKDMKRRYLVSQTNRQATDHFAEEDKINILLSDYEDLKLAKIHYNALTDKYRSILDLQNPEHVRKLEEMMGMNSKYRLWAAFIADQDQVPKRLNAKYSRNMRNYVAQKTNWQIGASQTIYPKLELIFGEFFVILKYRSQEIQIKLAELEKY